MSQVGAGIQIPPNSSRILARWGILPAVEEHSVRPLSIIMRSYRSGELLSTQPLFPLIEDVYGAPYLHIHRADFHAALVEAARNEGVEIRVKCSVTGIDFDTPCVRIKNHPDFKADIILGADGLRSICREEMLGHADPPHPTGDLAYRITVKASDMQSHPELLKLAENPSITFWLGPQSHAVCYFLKGGGLFNIVLLCPDNLPEMTNTAKADLKEMREIFADWDPKLRTLLGLVQESSKWRLQNSHEMSSWRHDSGKFALLGDACHATLPYLYLPPLFPCSTINQV
jgi:salicylate hydroxylase